VAASSGPEWFFPPLGGGEENGLNESGIEHFKRPESLGRETCQNIVDNRDASGKPAIAEFELLALSPSEFPGHADFVRVFAACRDYVLLALGEAKGGTGNEAKFFETGMAVLGGKTIPTLRIGDENTTGLSGNDADRTKPFWRLLKGQGFSNLQGVGGGTYGIGQRAPFAHSAIRTLLYSTRLVGGEEAFVAKSILASHLSPFPPSRKTQNKGWFCHTPAQGTEEWTAIRDPKQIPPRFRRMKVGTDIYVTGFLMPDWERRIRDSVLVNFFSAIDRGLLEVRIKKDGKLVVEINRANLEQHLLQAADEAQTLVKKRQLTKTEYRDGLGATIYYLKALRNPLGGTPITKTIEDVGEVKLYVHRDVHDPRFREVGMHAEADDDCRGLWHEGFAAIRGCSRL